MRISRRRPDMSDSVEKLAVLIREAAAAHHQTFIATNGDDPEWPAWYAQYLVPRLQQALDNKVDQSALAADLREIDSQYRAGDRKEQWPEFYARWLLDKWKD